MMKLSARNYFEILGMGVGAAFLGYGLFRFRYIRNYFAKRDRKT
jgi:hypothetical protein